MMDVNVIGLNLCTQLAVKSMLKVGLMINDNYDSSS